MILKKLILACTLLFISATAALAFGAKTEDSCAGVGSVVVKCYDCANKKYLGKVAVLTDYEEYQGKKYCVPARETKETCSRVFGINSNSVGFYAKFKSKGTTHEEFYDTTCVKAIGY